MQLQGDAADNPDQRMSDDVKLFVSQTLDDRGGAAQFHRSLASFVVILWGLSAAAPLVLYGIDFTIPGYLVLAALIYAIFGTALTQWIGSPLVNLDFNQQRMEADFRFNLVRVRENSEQIALLKGEAGRTRAAVGALLPRHRQLVRHHEPHQAADGLHPELCTGGGDDSLRAGLARLFRQQDPARRADPDRGGLRPGAGRTVLLRHGLPHHGGMARGGRSSRRV